MAEALLGPFPVPCICFISGLFERYITPPVRHCWCLQALQTLLRPAEAILPSRTYLFCSKPHSKWLETRQLWQKQTTLSNRELAVKIKFMSVSWSESSRLDSCGSATIPSSLCTGMCITQAAGDLNTRHWFLSPANSPPRSQPARLRDKMPLDGGEGKGSHPGESCL